MLRDIIWESLCELFGCSSRSLLIFLILQALNFFLMCFYLKSDTILSSNGKENKNE